MSRSNRIMIVGACGITLAAWLSFAQEPAETPVPLTAEPSHHQVLVNADVRVFRIEVAPGAATRVHEHTNDFIWFPLGDADIMDHPRDGAEAPSKVADGAITFRPHGIVHAISNNRDVPFRNMTIEFLHAQTGGRNQCGQVIRDQPLDCPSSAGDSRKKGQSMIPQLKTDQTQVSLLILDPDARFTFKASKRPPVLVALEGADADALVEMRITGAVGKGERPLHGGDAMEVPPGMALELHNGGSVPARFAVLEFRSP